MKRTTFMSSTAFGATGVALSSSLAAADPPGPGAVPGGTNLVERRANFDFAGFERVLGRNTDDRVVWEAVAYVPTFLNNVKNALNGMSFGFGIDASKIAMAVAGHGPSSCYTYADYVWQKYRIGEFFALKDAQGNPIASNVFLAKRATTQSNDPDDENGPLQDTSVEALQARGVTFLTCHTAVEEQARGLVKRGFAPAGAAASDVAADILTHLVPGAIVVPSMVATIAVLQQRYHYAYLTIQ